MKIKDQQKIMVMTILNGVLKTILKRLNGISITEQETGNGQMIMMMINTGDLCLCTK